MREMMTWIGCVSQHAKAISLLLQCQILYFCLTLNSAFEIDDDDNTILYLVEFLLFLWLYQIVVYLYYMHGNLHKRVIMQKKVFEVPLVYTLSGYNLKYKFKLYNSKLKRFLSSFF